MYITHTLTELLLNYVHVQQVKQVSLLSTRLTGFLKKLKHNRSKQAQKTYPSSLLCPRMQKNNTT